MTCTSEQRCAIPPDDPLFQKYHDFEWGLPVGDDQRLYEKVCLEGFQSGLSWRTILHRRPAFREAFARFDAQTVAGFDATDVTRLMQNERIIRNRRKIESAINNAQRALELRDEFGSLANFFWQYAPADADRPLKPDRQWLAENPTSAESVAMAKALKKRGWSFVGPTTLYALMQACGLVNDHVHGCPVRESVEQARQQFLRQLQA